MKYFAILLLFLFSCSAPISDERLSVALDYEQVPGFGPINITVVSWEPLPDGRAKMEYKVDNPITGKVNRLTKVYTFNEAGTEVLEYELLH